MNSSVDRPSLPPPAQRALEKFGHDLSLARRRRRFSQASMADRVGISVASLRRLEAGDPGVSFGAVARALHVLGELEKLSLLLDTAHDDLGLALMDAQLPRRIRARKLSPDSGAL
jgi:transcriptional regulator with XRE-family HTH domain